MKQSLAMKKLAVALGSAAVLSVGMVSAAEAAPIIGTIQFSLGYVRITLNYPNAGSGGNVDFNAALGGPFEPAPNAIKTSGPHFQIGGGTGSFADASFSGVTTGTIGDLNSLAADANYAPLGLQPGGGRTSYLTFAPQPTWRFTMNFLEPGNQAGSPYSLSQQGDDVLAGISMSGTACVSANAICGDDVGDSQTTVWHVVISTQFLDTDVAALQTKIVTDGFLPNSQWSAALAVPEPGTLALIGITAVGLAGLGRRAAKTAV